jgi:hypothetical protein
MLLHEVLENDPLVSEVVALPVEDGYPVFFDIGGDCERPRKPQGFKQAGQVKFAAKRITCRSSKCSGCRERLLQGWAEGLAEMIRREIMALEAVGRASLIFWLRDCDRQTHDDLQLHHLAACGRKTFTIYRQCGRRLLISDLPFPGATMASAPAMFLQAIRGMRDHETVPERLPSGKSVLTLCGSTKIPGSRRYWVSKSEPEHASTWLVLRDAVVQHLDQVEERARLEQALIDPALVHQRKADPGAGTSDVVAWTSGHMTDHQFALDQALHILGRDASISTGSATDPDNLDFDVEDPPKHIEHRDQRLYDWLARPSYIEGPPPPPLQAAPAQPATPANPQQQSAAPPASPGVPANPRRQRPAPAPRAAAPPRVTPPATPSPPPTPPPGVSFATDDVGLQAAVNAVEAAACVAVAAWRGVRGEVLLLALEAEKAGTQAAFIIDPSRVSLAGSKLWDALAAKKMIVHDAMALDGLLGPLGFRLPQTVQDTKLRCRVLAGDATTPCDLTDCCHRLLRRLPPVTGAAPGPWSTAALACAAGEVALLRPLIEETDRQAAFWTRPGQVGSVGAVFSLEERALHAVCWLSRNGLPVDREGAEAEAAKLTDAVVRRRGQLDAAAAIDWGNATAAKKFLTEERKLSLADTAKAALLGTGDPVAKLLSEWRSAGSALTAVESLLHHLQADGRVYATWSQIGTDTGRLSCHDPNLTGIPRTMRHLVKAPPGRVLVAADYSSFEPRILAMVSRDDAFAEVFRQGKDIYGATAAAALGLSEEEARPRRSIGKKMMISLAYGAGEETLAQGAGITVAEAEACLARFFSQYPGVKRWHDHAVNDKCEVLRNRTGRLRTNVTTPQQRLNTPIQSLAADFFKAALALLWERRHEVPGALLVLALHDAPIVECDEDQADAVAALLRQAASITCRNDFVPFEVEVSVGPSLAGGKIIDPPA